MFIDTHCHLSLEDYDDIDLIVSENLDSGVSKMIVSACTKESIVESLGFAKKYDCVYLTIGYHPSEVLTITDADLLTLEDFLLEEPKVVGIGEIGLDYHYGKENRKEQLVLFEKQLALAEKHHLPVVIHSRDALSDTIELLKKYPDVQGIMHCFSGSLETAKIFIKMGFYLGIGGVITFKNSRLSEVVQQLGLEYLVLETDSPYLTPQPYRGKKNSSKYLPLIAQRIADVCQVDLEQVAKVTSENASKLFDLK